MMQHHAMHWAICQRVTLTLRDGMLVPTPGSFGIYPKGHVNEQ
jgi:hypothetical protein